MVRLPDIPIQSWLQDQADRFHEATAGHFDALEFDDGARQMESSIPPDYDAPGGMDQWQAVEQQRIQDEQERARQAEEQRRAQQAALEEQQRQQQEAQAQQAREQQAMSWAEQLGIPSPESLGSELTRWWNRPADHIGTTGVLDASTPPLSQQPLDPDLGPHEQPYPGTVSPIINPDGSATTERSITVTEPDLNGGRPTNIPTVWSGRVVDDDTAITNAINSRRDYSSYGSIDEAVGAAEQRSRDLGTGQVPSVGGAQLSGSTPERSTPVSPADQFLSWAGGLGQVARQALPGGRSGVSPQDQHSASATFEPTTDSALDQDHVELEALQARNRDRARRFVTEGLPEAVRSIPEALSAGAERFDAARRPSADAYDLPTPRNAMDVLLQSPARGAEVAKLAGGLPAAYTALSEGIGGVTNTLGRAAIRGSGGSDEAGSSGIDLEVPYYGRFAPSQQDLGGLVAENLLDPTNLIGGGAEAHVVRELGPAVARQFSLLAAEHGPEMAFKILGITPAPSLLRNVREVAQAGADAGIPLGRGARQFAGHVPAAAEHTAEQAAGVQYLGSGLTPYMGTDPAGSMMRQRVIPPEVARQLDYFPLNIPDDPEIIRAVERAGGTVDEHGTTVNTIRLQGRAAHGGEATRGGTFHTAGKPGSFSEYETSADDALGVGGTERIEGETTYRNPLWISEAPGDTRGFEEAMQKMGVLRPVTPERIAQLERNVASRRVRLQGLENSIHPDPYQIREMQDQIGRYERELADARSGRGRPLRATEVTDAVYKARDAGPEGSPERAAALKAAVAQYGGDPDLIDGLLRIRGADASESVWAVKENIVNAHARKNRHDAVLTVKRGSAEVDPFEVQAHPLVANAKADLDEIFAAQEQAQRAHDALYESKLPAEFRRPDDEPFGLWMQRLSKADRLDAYDAAREAAQNHPDVLASERELQKLDAAYQNAEDAYINAMSQAEKELGGSEISELVDARMARNPTPGRPPEHITRLEEELAQAQTATEQAYKQKNQVEDDWVRAHPGAFTEDATAALRDHPDTATYLQHYDRMQAAEEALKRAKQELTLDSPELVSARHQLDMDRRTYDSISATSQPVIDSWRASNPEALDGSFWQTPTGQALSQVLMDAGMKVQASEAAVNAAEQAAKARGRGRPGYEIRADIPVPEGVRRSTIGPNPRANNVEALKQELQAAQKAWDAMDEQMNARWDLHPGASWDEMRGFYPQIFEKFEETGKRVTDLEKAVQQAGTSSEPPFITLGSGVQALRNPALNAAQGAVFGAASETLQAQQEGRDTDYREQLKRAGMGAGLGLLAGSRGARRLAGRALGSGVTPEGEAGNTAEQFGKLLGGMGKDMGLTIREADLREAQKRMLEVRRKNNILGPEYDAAVAETPLGKQIAQYQEEIAARRGEVPNPHPLTPEEQALNDAADARARAAPPHSGYLEDPSFGAADDLADDLPLADHPDDLPLRDPDMAPDPFEMVPEAEHLLERADDLPIASLDEETGAILSHLEAKGGMQAIKNGRSLRNAERRLRAQRREHGLVGPQYDALVAETPLGKQVDQLRTNAAREALPDVPPPPEARPAPTAGSAPKTVDTGPATVPPPSEIENWKPFGLHEEVMLKDGSTGKIIGAQRFRGKAADDILTIRKEDGSLVQARGSQVERQGMAPTASSPHPGFSTGESVPLSRQTSQDGTSTPAGSPTYARYGQPGGTGRDHPPRLGPPDPGPSPVQGPPRPRTGPGSAVDADAEKIRKMYEDVSAGRIKAQEPSDAVVDRVIGTMANVAKNLDKARDRRAVIKYVGNHLANSRNSPLTDEENAHLIALNYEGHEGVSNARIVRNLGPALKGQTRENMMEADIIMTQLDNADKDAYVRNRTQQDALSKVPEARPPKDNVRREGEAVLNETRARASYKAAERDWVKARQERDDLIAEMQRLGEPTEGPSSPSRPGGKPGVVRSIETERSQAMQDRLERANLRHDIADLRRQDEGRLLQAATEKKQKLLEDKVMERAATKAETVASERKLSGGATPQEISAILKSMTERMIAKYGQKEGTRKADEINKIADAHYKLRDEMREAYVDAGIWSPEHAKELFEQFPHYSPIKILEHMKRADEAFTNGRSFSVRDDLIRHLTDEGTEALRMKPTEAMLHMVHQGDEAIQRNRVMRAVIGWAEDPSMDPFIKPMSVSATAADVPDGFKMMVGRVNGTTQNVAVLKELADGLQDWTPAQSGIIMRAVKGAHNYYVASLTGLRPSFIVMNAVNDAVMALARFAVESPNPLEALRGVKDLYNGYRASFGSRPMSTRMVTGAFLGAGGETVRESGQDEGYTPASFLKIGAAAGVGALAGRRFKATAGDLAAIERMKAAGGQVNAAGRFTAPADVLRELRGERPWVRSVQAPVFKDIKTTADLKTYIHERLLKQGVEDIGGLLYARPLQEIGAVVERGPRLAAFMRAERQGKSQMQAASAARRVTADPAMGGKTIKQLNNFIPFLNMSTQAAAEGIEMAQRNPAKFSAMMGIVAGTVVMNEIWNHHVAPEDSQDITQYTRDTGLAFVAPWGPKGDGKRDILTIPTRGIVGSVVPLVREAMSLIYGTDQRTWDRLAGATGLATINQFSPVNADVNGLLRMTTPPLAAAAWEYVSNHDAFRDQPIVSRSMESLPTTMQYDDRTSQLARILARSNLPLVGGSSPMKMEWGLRAISAGPGEAVLGLADMAIRLSGNAQPSDVTRDIPKGGRDAPVFGSIAGRFLRTVGSERQNRAYQAADDTYARMEPDVIALLERSPEYQQASPDEQRTMLRSAKQQAVETARDLSGVPEFEREKTTTLPERYEGVKPGSSLEKRIAQAHSTKASDRTDEQWDLVSDYPNTSYDYSEITKSRREQSKYRQQQIEGLVTGQSVVR